MRTRNVFVALLGTVALLITASTGSIAQEMETSIEISPEETFWSGETIEVPYQPGGHYEPIYIHLTCCIPWHVEFIDVNLGGTGFVDWQWDIQPSFIMTPSVWYQVGVIWIDGPPSTTVTFSVNADLSDPMGLELPVSLVSNTITKHITPEPSSLLALGMGVLGTGGLLLRRRRK